MQKWLTLTLLSLTLLGEPVAAVTDGEKGLAIAREMDRRDAGWQDTSAGMRMTLRNRQGQESVRELRSRALEVEGDGDKALSIFDSPRDIKGTALLTYSHATSADDQWLYLPALKRIKRIASANKSGPFVGSEFAYEDLTSQEVDKYAYKWLRDEVMQGRQAMVIERKPSYEYSGYTRQVVWVDEAMYRPLRIDYFDRKGALLKTLSYHDYRLYLERFWRPDRMEMVNHQSGKSTSLEWFDYKFQTGLAERDFDKTALRRVH